MEDFNTYANNAKEELNNENPDLTKTVMDLVTKYNGASEKELLSAIYKEAEKSRKRGTLSDTEIDNFVKMLSPMLDDKKRKKLICVANELKKK